MVFFLLGILLLITGCRPPVTPARGWIRLAALTTLHPQQVMVTDLDHRLNGLLLERAWLAQLPTSSLPPARIDYSTPAQSALPAPPHEEAPLKPYTNLADQDRAALEQAMAHEQTREYARYLRELQARNAREMADTQLALERAAAADQLAIEQAIRTSLVSADLEVLTARERRQRYPKSESVRNRLDDALREQARLTSDYSEKMAHIAQKLTADIAAARTKIAATGADQLRKFRDQQQEQRMQTLAQETQRTTVETLQHAPEEPASSVTFTDTPGGALHSTHPELLRTATHLDTITRQNRRAELAALDRGIATLQVQRTQLVQDIQTDTRAMAVRVAEEHGYTLSFDTPAGRNLSPLMRGWIQHYWPAQPQPH